MALEEVFWLVLFVELLDPLDRPMKKTDQRAALVERALSDFRGWVATL